MSWPVRMAANWGGGRGLCADTVAIDEARMVAARKPEEKDDSEEERMFALGG